MRRRSYSRIPLAVLLLFTILGVMLVPLSSPAFTATKGSTTIKANTTLTKNLGPYSGNGLVITKNNIVLNCAGHTITGSATNTGVGITLIGRIGVVVENCIVTGFQYGFSLSGSSGNTLSGNTESGSILDGFYLSNSPANTLTNNIANNNGFWGFYLTGSSGNTLTKNTANNNNLGDGFILYAGSSNNILTGNTADNNYGTIGDDGFYIQSSSGNVFTSNTANSNSRDGFEAWSGSSNNFFTLNTASNNAIDGFYFYRSPSNTLTSNTASGNGWAGFDLYLSSYIFLGANTAIDTTSSVASFELNGSNYNILSGNTGSGNDAYGFYLLNSSNNALIWNTADYNHYEGFDTSTTYFHDGLTYQPSTNNVLVSNWADSNPGWPQYSWSGYGYWDPTSGSGTRGTANFYVNNECHGNTGGGSNPSGLGSPQS